MSSNHQVSPVLPKLAERIRRGEVVFFVGAGFSIDSEGMSAGVIVRRLWIRLEGLCELCWDRGGEQVWREFWATFSLNRYDGIGFGRRVRRWALMHSRPASAHEPHRRAKTHAIDDISSRYYELNEWLCKAYGRLLRLASRKDEQPEPYESFREALVQYEYTLSQHPDAWGELPSAIRADLYGLAQRAFGKADDPLWSMTDKTFQLGKLVLMASFGFWDKAAMAGRCREAEHLRGHGRRESDNHAKEAIEHAVRDRLRLRHHVLARLAREGYCPTLVTTNFDMLLEEAMHASGLEAEPHGGDGGMGMGHGPDRIAEAFSLQVPYYDVISDPHAFYLRGKAFKTAVLLKIHGCAGRVRSLPIEEAKASPKEGEPRPSPGGAAAAAKEGRLHPSPIEGEKASPKDGEPHLLPDEAADSAKEGRLHPSLATYLRQVVYTYREIQNWRQDHWTADFLRTLLRTRALVFAGYSTQDPVIHDTFRSVYEEMERTGQGYRELGKQSRRESPAYFLGYTDASLSMEFHANEVLHAASRSVGHETGRTDGKDHPHYLRFSKQGSEGEWLGLDDQMGLLAHLVLRRQQAEAIRTELPALVGRLTGGRQPAGQLARLSAAFRELEKRELRALYCRRHATPGPGSMGRRVAFEQAMAWSHGFHVALRREWALGLAVSQHGGAHGDGLRMTGLARMTQRLRQDLWYFPASDRPAWTAWSAVVELALRNMARVLCRRHDVVSHGRVPETEATHDVLPTVLIPFCRDQVGRACRLALTIELQGLGRADKPPRVAGHPARRLVWQFPPECLPWTASPARGDNAKRPDVTVPPSLGASFGAATRQPDALWIWKWALDDGSGDEASLKVALGIGEREASSCKTP